MSPGTGRVPEPCGPPFDCRLTSAARSAFSSHPEHGHSKPPPAICKHRCRGGEATQTRTGKPPVVNHLDIDRHPQTPPNTDRGEHHSERHRVGDLQGIKTEIHGDRQIGSNGRGLRPKRTTDSLRSAENCGNKVAHLPAINGRLRTTAPARRLRREFPSMVPNRSGRTCGRFRKWNRHFDASGT